MKREKLIQARIKKGLSQKVAAELLGVSRNTWNLWEQGKEDPYPLNVAELCKFFGVKEPGDLDLAPSSLRSRQAKSLDPVSTSLSDHQILLSHPPLIQGIMEEAGIEQEGQDLMDEARRQLMQQLLHTTGAAIVTPSALLEQFTRVLTRPPALDEKTLRYLETRTTHYWQDRHSAMVPTPVLLSYVQEHLHRLLTFLEASLFPSERCRLCALASETAQLIGLLYFELGDYSQAKSFHRQAIRAAQEADQPALEATAWGRLSFAWTYSGNPQKALSCTQQARSLAAGKSPQIVQAFLSAVEAEVQALLHDRNASLKALNDAERLEQSSGNTEELSWLHFDHARLEGYRGICFRRLYHPEKSQTTAFLVQAQNALKGALDTLLSSMLQHRPTLLIDLASTYTQQGEVEAACEHAKQAITTLAQMRSGVGTQRLLALRRDLAPWRDTTHVKNLDEQIATFLIPERRSGL